MMSFGDFGYWALAVATTALNVPFGRLRAGAARRSPRWFGVYAAAVFLLIGMRRAFAVSVIGSLALIAAMYFGQWLGRRAPARDCEPSPLRWRTVTYAALVAGVLLIIGRPVHADNDGHGVHAGGDDYQRLEVNEPAPAFSLVDQDGKRVSLGDFRGKAVVATFLYTHCTDVCPLLLQSLVFAEQKLTQAEREQVRFVAISVDPRRDTPEHLKSYMKERGLNAGRWTLLTGGIKEVTQVATDYGVVVHPAPQGDFVHNSVFIVIDGQGRERAELHGVATPVGAIVQEVRWLLKPVGGQM
jgi:protein SCO1